MLAKLAFLAEKTSDCLSDEVLADGGSKHDMLVEEGPSELRARCFDVYGGREVATSFGSSEDVMDGLDYTVEAHPIGIAVYAMTRHTCRCSFSGEPFHKVPWF